jgi:hypothetical protein
MLGIIHIGGLAVCQLKEVMFVGYVSNNGKINVWPKLSKYQPYVIIRGFMGD